MDKIQKVWERQRVYTYIRMDTYNAIQNGSMSLWQLYIYLQNFGLYAPNPKKNYEYIYYVFISYLS